MRLALRGSDVATRLNPSRAFSAFNTQALTRDEVFEKLQFAGLLGLLDTVMEGVKNLQQQAAETGDALSEKFATSAKFELTYGSLSLFFGGLEALVGPPSHHVEKAMESEHTQQPDSEQLLRNGDDDSFKREKLSMTHRRT